MFNKHLVDTGSLLQPVTQEVIVGIRNSSQKRERESDSHENNSERPVDALAEKGESLTHLLTT